jgi:hypothetical protein
MYHIRYYCSRKTVKKAYFPLNVLTEQYSSIQFIDKQAKKRWANY